MADGVVSVETLLTDCDVKPRTLAPMLERLRDFAARYQPRFWRSEQREHALMYLKGLLSDLPRKSIEPITVEHGVPRRMLQRFVGAGGWDDEAVMDELRAHVREELSDPDAVLVIDGSAFHKRGPESCGVKRQWCGRLGKTENCQIGVYLGYAAAKGHTLVAHRLYLPQEWASDRARRRISYVPDDVEFMTAWEIAAAMVEAYGRDLPHAWLAADDEFGRSTGFRDWMRISGERYVVDVPCSTAVRPLNARQRSRRKRDGFRSAEDWARALPPSAWTQVHIRDGEKGPLELLAVRAKVQTKRDGRPGLIEWLLVLKTLGAQPEWSFHLSNASDDVPLEEMVRVRAGRHRIEEDLERGKGEVGLAHYEVRSWVGWHHHMTLASLALFFLVLEQRRIGGKNPGDHDPASSGGAEGAAA